MPKLKHLDSQASSQTKEELAKLLRENIAAAKKREQSTFDKFAMPFNDSLVLFGAGNFGKKVFDSLRAKGMKPLAFSDNNPKIWGKFIDEVEILPPKVAVRKFGSRAIFVITICSRSTGYTEIKNQLTKLGCSKVMPFLPLAWKFSNNLLPYFHHELPHKILEHSDDIMNGFNLLYDLESRKQYLAQLRMRLLLDFEGLPRPAKERQYFPQDILVLARNEVFVDCGAFDGDSIKKFLLRTNGNFKKIIAFEPDPKCFLKISKYIRSLPLKNRIKINLFNYAVGKRKERLNFICNGKGSSFVSEKGRCNIDCVTLNDMLINEQPTFIKFDIEGAELDALKGAKKAIQRFRPILAVSAYHKPFDLWELSLYLNSFLRTYNFFLRMHYADGFDSVLYCIPQNRIFAWQKTKT